MPYPLKKGKSERNTLNLVELIHFEMLDLGAFFGRGGKKLKIRRRILLSLLPWLQLLKAGPQEYVVLLLGVVELVALAPVIGHSVGKDLPILVESRLRDRLLTSLAGLQLGAGVLVPEGEAAV